MEKPSIELSNMIAEVGDQIRKADTFAKENDRAVMEFIECELEIAFEISAESGGQLKVLAVQLEGAKKQNNTHRITLKYKALELPDGSSYQGGGGE